MARYVEWFSFKQKIGSEITGTMRIHKYYYDAEQVTDLDEIAVNTNIDTNGSSWGAQIVSVTNKNNTFIHRTIEIESSGNIVLSEFYGLTSFVPTNVCAGYGYTAHNSPIYYYTTSDSYYPIARPSGSIIGVGGNIPNVFYALPTSDGGMPSLGLVYCALYGDDEQMVDFILKYGNAISVDWRIYCFNEVSKTILLVAKQYEYDFRVNWDININDLVKDNITLDKIHISLLPYEFDTTLKSKLFELDYIPNIFDLYKNEVYPYGFANNTDPYQLELYLSYYMNGEQELRYTDKFRTVLGYQSMNTEQEMLEVTTRQGYILGSNDNSTIRFIFGKPEDDENYNVINIDSDYEEKPSDINVNDIISNIGCGANMYALTKSRFSALITWLWTSTFIDNIKLINNSPIENIISAKLFPFTISNGIDREVILGNVNTTIEGEKLDSTYDRYYRQLVDGYTVQGFYNNFLDYAPYTSISIYLPYIGIKNLDTNMIMGKTLDIYYTFDLTSGAVVASIYVDGNCLYMFEGVIGVDLPISASNRAQVDAAYVAIGASTVATIASAWIGASASIATASEKAAEKVATNAITSASVTTGKTALGSLVDSANVQFHTYTEGNFSPNTWGLLPKNVYIIYNRPTYQDIDTFRHVEGRHCMLSRNIGNLKGYTEVHSGIDLSGIPCDEELRARLKSILVGGFIA